MASFAAGLGTAAPDVPVAGRILDAGNGDREEIVVQLIIMVGLVVSTRAK